MADEEDDAQKTEDPTRKRLEDAAERGQVITSREMVSFLMLMTFTMIFFWSAATLARKTQASLAMFIQRPDSLVVDRESLGALLSDVIGNAGIIMMIPFASFIAAIFAANALQNRFVFSAEPLIPKLEKISLSKGISRLFSLRGLTEFLKGVVKMILVGAVGYYAVHPYFVHVQQLPEVGISGMLAFLITTVKRLLIGICIVMFFIAVFDFMYQRFEFIKGLRMSKQEVRDEFKQQEGDPQVKNRLRQIRMERARKRMIAAVPGADVIVTNPTHYSVALKYDTAVMRAPVVVAKGMDNIALRIREVAKEHDIPLFENAPLAQALYATVDIDKEVPAEHYKAVAEVISYVYRLRGKFAQNAQK